MFYTRSFEFPRWRVRSPFEDLERLRTQLDQLFKDGVSSHQLPQAGVFPLLNLTEDADKYYVRAELPGMKSEDLNIQVAAKSLSISGERKFEAEEAGSKYHRRERDEGQFSRVIGLPGEIDHDSVNADLKNGILTIQIPKAEATKPKKIEITS